MNTKDVARQIYEARVFFSSHNDGNTARCFIFYNEPAIATMLAYSNATADTCCFTWNADNAIQVRCYRRGQHITFCGHGLLACAHLWQQLTAVPSKSIEEVLLCTQDQEYTAVWRDGKLWLRAPRIHCETTELPDDIDEWFDKKPQRSALAGNGYRIFEFSSGIDIANIVVNMERLASEDRGVIVTQAEVPKEVPKGLPKKRADQSDLDTQPWSYQLRYFRTSVCGVEEDSATGFG